MVDANVVSLKLRELADRISRVRLHEQPDAESLARNRDALDLVSFNLLLAVQACLDIASHVISEEGWEPASTLAGAFERLSERGVISEPTARALRRAAGLRNVVAHGYSESDPTLIHSAAVHGLSDLERYAAEVSAWMSRR